MQKAKEICKQKKQHLVTPAKLKELENKIISGGL